MSDITKKKTQQLLKKKIIDYVEVYGILSRSATRCELENDENGEQGFEENAENVLEDINEMLNELVELTMRIAKEE